MMLQPQIISRADRMRPGRSTSVVREMPRVQVRVKADVGDAIIRLISQTIEEDGISTLSVRQIADAVGLEKTNTLRTIEGLLTSGRIVRAGPANAFGFCLEATDGSDAL